MPAGTSQEDAKRIATSIAGDRSKAIIAGLVGAERGRGPVTLNQILSSYHGSRKAQGWRPSHRREQDRQRKFWGDSLGLTRPVESITADEVERAAGATAVARKWSPRTERKALKYLKAVTRFAYRKARLLNSDPLAAVELPRSESAPVGLEYSDQEVTRLCKPDARIDWRVTIACNIAADVGRRIGAIRYLKRADVRVKPGRVWLTFRSESDKLGEGNVVPVSEQTFELILEALRRPEVQEGGWLLPGGQVGSLRSCDVPWGGVDPSGSAGPIRKLHDAEKLLGIECVKGRGYHGLKRSHVSVSWEIAGGDSAKVGDLTGNTSPDVLRRHYRKARTADKEDHVDQIRARFQEVAVPVAVPREKV